MRQSVQHSFEAASSAGKEPNDYLHSGISGIDRAELVHPSVPT